MKAFRIGFCVIGTVATAVGLGKLARKMPGSLTACWKLWKKAP